MVIKVILVLLLTAVTTTTASPIPANNPPANQNEVDIPLPVIN
jgi:hypothetical protein